jgi:uncharacterized membrane protein HdeD (DUF308 family)
MCGRVRRKEVVAVMADTVMDDAKEMTSGWGWYLAAGIAWVLFSFIVLSFNFRTVWAIAIFFGIGFIVGGIMELAVAAVSPGWKWLYITIGIISIIAGIVALAWPGETFLVLAAIIGWLLLFYGIVDVVVSIGTRHIQDLWWLQLILGIAMMGIGLWAIAPDNQTVSTWRGTVLLVFWVGIAALMRGISDIIVGFRVRAAHKALTNGAA